MFRRKLGVSFMKKNFISALVIVSTLTVSCLTGCNNAGSALRKAVASGEASIDKDSEGRKTLNSAFQKLKGYNKPYVVTTQQTNPYSTDSHITVVLKDKTNYVEYPVSSDSSKSSSKSSSYINTDWMTADGDFYVRDTKSTSSDSSKSGSSDGTTLVYEKMPATYSKNMEGRIYSYLPDILEKASNIKKTGTKTDDLGNGNEKFDMYECTIPAETVSELLSKGSLGIYQSVYSAYPDDKNIRNFCKYYIKTLKDTLVFSKGSVVIGVADGMIKYVSITAGGGGIQTTISNAVITKTSGMKFRSEPDFSDAADYVETNIKPQADYAATFDSMEDAMQALQSQNSSASNESNSTN